MPQDKHDPISTFIAQHPRENSADLKRLKQVLRKRMRYALKTNLPWREPEPPAPERDDEPYNPRES